MSTLTEIKSIIRQQIVELEKLEESNEINPYYAAGSINALDELLDTLAILQEKDNIQTLLR